MRRAARANKANSEQIRLYERHMFYPLNTLCTGKYMNPTLTKGNFRRIRPANVQIKLPMSDLDLRCPLTEQLGTEEYIDIENVHVRQYGCAGW